MHQLPASRTLPDSKTGGFRLQPPPNHISRGRAKPEIAALDQSVRRVNSWSLGAKKTGGPLRPARAESNRGKRLLLAVLLLVLFGLALFIRSVERVLQGY